MTDKFCITMDSKEGLALLLHMPKNIVKFNKFSNGLYTMDPNYARSFILTKKHYQFMNALEEKLKYLSLRQ